MQTDFSRLSHSPLIFEFAISCQKIKVWYMNSNGILFLNPILLFIVTQS